VEELVDHIDDHIDYLEDTVYSLPGWRTRWHGHHNGPYDFRRSGKVKSGRGGRERAGALWGNPHAGTAVRRGNVDFR
jgi:hypothetical protein